jgi:hypothetical protein
VTRPEPFRSTGRAATAEGYRYVTLM